MEYGEAINIKISISNQSKKALYIFKDFTFTSNLFPNPIETVNQSASIHFLIEPVPDFSATWVEWKIVITKNQTIKLRPYEQVHTQYDLGRHLNKFISNSDEEGLTNRPYRIKVKFSNGGAHSLTSGEYLSNEVVVYVKE